MNPGLLLKTLRESWVSTLGFALGLMTVEMALGYVLPRYQEQISSAWLQLEFVQQIGRALLGIESPAALGPEMFTALAWLHPIVLAIVFAHAILFCTRVPAGEVDRGTIDVLLGLPISRGELYRSETVLWLLSGIFVLLMGALGNMFGAMGLRPELRPDPMRIGIVIANLLGLYLAVGGLSWLASAMSSRRGRAISALFAVVIVSLLLSYLSQFWSVAERLSFLSLLEYYRPSAILRDGAWPVGDLAVLVGSGAVAWTLAGIIFARRDLSTV